MSRRDRRSAAAARGRLLPEGRLAGPMPWIIAVMMFLTVLAAAAGLGLGTVVRSIGADLSGRATVQVVEADAQARATLTKRTVEATRKMPAVMDVTPVDPEMLSDQLRPWLGEDATSGDLPIPALIDVTLRPGAPVDATMARLRTALAALSPNIRLEPHAAFLQPLARLLSVLGWLAGGLVLLMTLATASVVVLAARGAHDGHRATIEVLHLMGATDVQIARLFQRRIALDALLGCALGFALAVMVVLALATRLEATGTELIAAVALRWQDWALLCALPLSGVLLAAIAARRTVLGALGRAL